MARATAFAIEPLLDAAQVGPGVRVLDVGCGPGALSAAAAAARGARHRRRPRRGHARRRRAAATRRSSSCTPTPRTLPFDGRRVRRRARRVHRQPPARTPSGRRPSWHASPGASRWPCGAPRTRSRSSACPPARRRTSAHAPARPGRAAVHRRRRARGADRRHRARDPDARSTSTTLDALWDGVRGGTVRTAARLAAASPRAAGGREGAPRRARRAVPGRDRLRAADHDPHRRSLSSA